MFLSVTLYKTYFIIIVIFRKIKPLLAVSNMECSVVLEQMHVEINKAATSQEEVHWWIDLDVDSIFLQEMTQRRNNIWNFFNTFNFLLLIL